MKIAKKKEPKLGSGERFKRGAEKIEKKQGLSKKAADAIMAVAGRKSLGAKKMASLAKKGKARKAREKK